MAARSAFFPSADTHTQRFDATKPGIAFSDGVHILVLHTEETSGGWPGYSSGAAAPNMSCLPDMKAKVLRSRGHFPANMSARALVNAPGGVLTNTDGVGVFQIELAGTCSKRMVALYSSWGLTKNVDYIFWPEAPDWALRELARIIAWLSIDWGLPLVAVAPALWTDCDQGKSTRMTFAQWLHFRGVCGHQHVPENDHRDPGNIDIAKLMRFAAEEVAKAKGTTTPPRSTTRTVVVRAGQTLAGIALAAGITLAALLAVNPSIHDPNHIVPGQTVTLPPTPAPSVTAKPTPKPTVTPTAKPTPKPTPKPVARARATVQLGSTGPLVRIVQRAVKANVDGEFGQKTQAAVVAFQRRHKLVADGVVGPKTWAAIG